MQNILKIYFFIRGFPSIFIFWLLMLYGDVPMDKAALWAAIYALSFTIFACHADVVSRIDYALAAFFIFSAALSHWYADLALVWIVERFSTVLISSIFLFVYLSSAFGMEPFTMAFAKKRTDPALWQTTPFENINRLMVTTWQVAFLVLALITIIPTIWTRMVVPIAFVTLFGIPFNRKFPAIYLRQIQKRSQSSRPDAAAEDLDGTPETEITNVIRDMAKKYNSINVGDFSGRIQFQITDMQDKDCFLDIKENQCLFHYGTTALPDVTVQTPASVWIQISRKEISGQDAFFRNLFAIEGDLNLFLRLKDVLA